MDINEKQLAVRRALQAFLEPLQLDQAMKLWLGSYASKPTFALQGFVRECSVAFSLEKRRNDMYISLVHHMSSVHLHLQNNPSDETPSPPASNSAPGDATSPARSKPTAELESESFTALAVLRLVIDQLCRLSGSDAPEDIRTYMRKNLASLHLPEKTSVALEKWLSGRANDNDQIEITVSTMQRLVNCAYVALCEYFGPVRADYILDGAIRNVSQTPPGRRFSPKNFL